VRFAWTDDQLAFRDAARDLFAKGGEWDDLDAMGITSVLVPEAAGGLGLDECSLVPVLEESGRVALAMPIVETAMVGAPLDVAGRVTAAWRDDPVPWPDDTDAVLVVSDAAVGRVDAGDLEPIDAVDPRRPLARWRGGRAKAATVTDDPGEVSLAFDRAALGTAAQLVGLSWAMLDLAVTHVTDRHQFGVPIGSFQAVKHHLANARIAVEFAAPAGARAAWSVAEDEPTRARDVSMAKALATDAASTTGRAALQCHGAIGYTVEHDLHLSLKRSWALARCWGDRSFHADRVGRALEGDHHA
jgi:alkylation response protein AidB-like acyl-CoA dehydrogenase